MARPLLKRVRMLRSLAVLALAAVPLGGCDLYFGGDDEPPCAYGGGGAVGPDIANGYRNPYSGQCEYPSNPYPCDDSCGPCPADHGAPVTPDWATCYSHCEGLSEDQCVGESGCYAAYLGEPSKYEFLGCFATAPSGPVQGSCDNLDAQACSRHDNCSALYSPMGSQHFIDCMPETPSTCGNCPTGYHCEQKCDANAMCEQVCVSNLTCASVDCAPGYTCAEVCANGKCGPTCVVNPGSCTGQVICAMPPPACPTGTSPGIGNGCWTGYCIPNSQCPLPACSTLTSESSCVSRSDCTPVYDGSDCTCYPSHCECKVLTYERCEAL